MGHKARRVPPNWQHPKNPECDCGCFLPLLATKASHYYKRYDEGRDAWPRSFHNPATDRWEPVVEPEAKDVPWEAVAGERLTPDAFLPEWDKGVATHWQMYLMLDFLPILPASTIPISPVLPTPEALARWLSENDAPAGPDMTASYSEWLAMILVGSCPGVAIRKSNHELVSGVSMVGEHFAGVN